MSQLHDGSRTAEKKRCKSIQPTEQVNRGRHEYHCGICKHPDRENIERDFVAWKSPAAIADEYRLSNRVTVYRHAHAFGLFVKRQRNVRAALERIIERTDDVEVNASAVVAAVQAYAKINARGEWVDRSEHVNLNELFERMTRSELESYAEGGILPAWFPQAVPATTSYSQEEESGS
jgi:hypothetical protein